ncbi:MAG: methyltransferase domain-containing protein [Gammaproteobacteria bacterium]|nr:methyltransferase domain-containing protein [Gammaproteobacteria bacterium]MDP2349432.1 methyltransferase domain-containing protein [Gammaproteobacteria bacterium]
MSQSDRDKWNQRYREGAYSERSHPAVFLTAQMPIVLGQQTAARTSDHLRALDLACGAGRNAFYLADLGYHVDAVDVSADAIARARSNNTDQQNIRWIEYDLDDGLPPEILSESQQYDLVIMIRYLDVALAQAAALQLRPGGYLVCEAHLVTDQEVAGPSGSAFRAVPGELREAARGLELVSYWEGITQDPDNQPVALARLVAHAVGESGDHRTSA